MIRTILDRELDIGSNENIFWYWSRRDEYPGLYYAKHEDYSRTRLKTPFNPAFLKECCGLDTIPVKNVKFIEKGNDILVIEEIKNSFNELVMRTIFVNQETELIEGFVITDMVGNPIASCEIQSWNRDKLPMAILFNWHEEKKTMLMELKNPMINMQIQPKVWELPNITPTIDMAVE